MKRKFQENSSLEFTYENGHHKLVFLDVLETDENSIHQSVYRKPTNRGELLNYKSECHDKYKKGEVYVLPKELDEKVARLHLPSLGAELTELRKE